MDPFDAATVRDAYDAVAEDYAATFMDDLAELDLDRAVLDAAFDRLRGTDPVVEVGCGPGQVSRYLEARGARCIGVDLSPQMLVVARRTAEGALLACADLRSMPIRTGSCSGVVAFYSIQHFPRADLGPALTELGRVLHPDGILVLAAHLGEGETTFDEFLGHHIAATGGTFYGADELTDALDVAGFAVEDRRTRGSLPHEHASQRIYLIARRS